MEEIEVSVGRREEKYENYMDCIEYWTYKLKHDTTALYIYNTAPQIAVRQRIQSSEKTCSKSSKLIFLQIITQVIQFMFMLCVLTIRMVNLM